ncbi:MAG: polyprenyl synthetase family protein [Trueperaceae bacterium]|nr:MAG: polyprenyl synthetase family protein [Trueperaceae bacterium]
MPLIADRLEAFESRIQAELRSEVAFIEAIGGDLVGAGGKRLRPSISFLAGALVGADDEASMQVALAVELLHSASLLHDDLIDDADTRRGAKAAFRRYGNVVSVMSGDYMLARVLGILAQLGSDAFTQRMSETAARICEGEVLQFQMATLETWDLPTYEAVIEGKTAVLVATAAEGPALVSGADPASSAALRDYGMAYGRAFQLRDDYLDLLGDPERLGKPVGGDLREGKVTLPVLGLITGGHDEALAIVRRHAGDAGDVERMIELVREHGGDRDTQRAIAHEVVRAQAALATLPAGPERDALMALPEAELERIR